MRIGSKLLDFTDAGIWFAPSTLLWCAVMLIAPAALICASRVAWRVFQRSPGKSRQEQLQAGANYFAVSPYWEMLVYALLAQVAPAALAVSLEKTGRDAGLVLSHPTAGVIAATALTLMFVLAFTITVFVAILLASRYRAALLGDDKGLVATILLFSGAAGCVTAAIWCLLLGPPLSLIWLVGAGMLAAVALQRWRLPGPGGRTMGESVQDADRRDRMERGRRAAQLQLAAVTGEYVGERPFRYWGRIIAFALVVFWLVFVTSYLWLVAHALTPPRSLFYVIVLVLGGLPSGALWPFLRRPARRVEWGEQGIRVVWYDGRTRRYAWSDLVSLRYVNDKGPGSRATVKTVQGQTWYATSSGPGYAALCLALEAHIWAEAGRDES